MWLICCPYCCPQPAVAVGNVAQLAVDLIVSTLNMSRVGFIHTDCLIPMAGNNPYTTCKDNAEELHTPAEGIQNKDNPFYVLLILEYLKNCLMGC